MSVGVGSAAITVKSLNKNFGAASLHVGCIRKSELEPGKPANLDVVPDMPTEECPIPDPNHANVVNVPPCVGANHEDTLLAERIAGILAKQSRFVQISKDG